MKLRFNITIILCFSILFGLAQKDSEIMNLEKKLQYETEHIAICDILNRLSELYIDTLPAKALGYANRGLTISANVGYIKGRIQGYTNVGLIYENTGNYEEAVQAFLQTKTLYEAENDHSGVATSLINLGIVYKESGFRSKAINYFNQAIREADKSNDRIKIGRAYTELGKLHFYQSKSIPAIEFFQEALKLFYRSKDNIDAAECEKFLGIIYRDDELYSEALPHFLKAAEVYKTNPIEPDNSEVNLNLGLIFFNMSQENKALDLLEKSLPEIEKTDRKESLLLAYKTLNEAYRKKGQYDKAYDYFRLYSSIKDAGAVSEMQVRLNAEKKAHENEKLIKQQELTESKLKLKDTEISKRNTIVLFMIIGLSVILILFLFLLRAYRHNKHANILLAKAKLEAENSREGKERFLAYVSHEIRTPLNAIVGMSQLLSLEKFNDKQLKRLNTIKLSADNLLIIVNDILDMSKIESGMLDLEKIDFLFSEIVNNIAQIVRSKAEAKNIALIIELDDQIPPILLGDPIRLNQILLNLTDNAIKFTRIGHIKVLVKVIQKNDKEVKLHFEVSDTGIGILNDKLQSIFKPFKQESSSVAREYGGSGLGLNIVQQLVEIQGGHIEIESQLNVGTKFYFDMVYEIGSASSVKDEENTHIDKSIVNNKRLLVVDDNNLNQEVIVDLLTELNKTVIVDTANNGLSATEMAAATDYDLILMDIQMPGMNGYEATSFIRENLKGKKAEVPIVAMTAHALSGVADRCLESGMNGYVSKPIKLNKLLIALGSVFVGIKHTNNEVLLPKYQTIDLTSLLELSNHDNEKLIKYIDIFLNNIPEDIERLEEYADKEEFEEMGKVAHKLKSNISYMGIKELEQTIIDLQAYKNNLNPNGRDALIEVNKVSMICKNAMVELKDAREKFGV